MKIGPTQGRANDVAVELRHQEAVRQIELVEHALLVEVGSCIRKIGGTIAVNLSVENVASRCGVDVDLCAAATALVGVVLGRVDPNFLDKFRRGSREAVAVGAVDARIGLLLAAGRATLTDVESITLRVVF